MTKEELIQNLKTALIKEHKNIQCPVDLKLSENCLAHCGECWEEAFKNIEE